MTQHQETQNSTRFAILFALCLCLANLGYAFFFRYAVIRDDTTVPVSFKQLLLEKIQGPRILIDSGSSGLHAFDAKLVESLIGFPTVLLSDHAGASLHDKVERLWKYSKPGDIVILPLEWNYYHAPDLSENHLRSLVDMGRGYFYSLPFDEQLMRAFVTPLSVVADELLKSGDGKTDDYATELKRLQFFHDHHFLKAPNGGIVVSPDKKKLPRDSDCDGYIIPEFAKGPIGFTKEFEASIRSLARLQKKREVQIILTAPVVVGADCYERYGASLQPMVDQTVSLCAKLGIRCLMDFRRYALPVDYLLDTHFHVTAEGSEIATPMIVGDIVAKGWITPKTLIKGTSVEDQIPVIFRDEFFSVIRAKMPFWHGNPTRIVDGDDREQFYFGQDWYDEEDWGRWASVEDASIIFRPDPKFEYEGIYVNAQYFNGSQKTKVTLNGHLIAEQDFSEDHLIHLEKPLARYLDGDPMAVLSFGSSNRISPDKLGTGSDIRQLKFGLHSLELIRRE